MSWIYRQNACMLQLLQFISHIFNWKDMFLDCITFLPSFIAGRGPTYFWTSALRPYITFQCASPGRGRELVGVYDVCMTCERLGYIGVNSTACPVFVVRPPRHGLLSGLALTGAVCCTSQWPPKSICFSHASVANTLTLLISVSPTVTVYRGHHRTAQDYLPVHHVRRNY